MNIKLYITVLLALLVSNHIEAQVGIGNPNPDTSSVLDLTNPNNKGLILPEATSQSAMSPTNGMIYTFEDNIFFKRSDGYNSITPWKFKFNGDISNHVYYNLNGNIGIGITDITVSPEAPLQIETDSSVSLLSNGSLILGKSDSTNLIFNSNEIQSRNNGNATPLTINRNGGDVTIGSKQTPSNLKVSNKNKSEYKPTGTTYDLMPTGAICMWSGSAANIPLGWAMCDGGKYPKSINKNDSIITPDMSGRFIVGVGNNGVHNYNTADTGGVSNVKLTIQQMPNHQHHAHDLGHTHSYTYEHYVRHKDGNKAFLGIAKKKVAKNHAHQNETTDNAYGSLAQDAVGGNMPHENRPSYYALIYIIKL